MRHLYHAPADWLCERTSARNRRAINFWLLILWLIPGTIVWIILRDALWFIGWMSLYAIWISHLGALSAETPVEEEQ
jgi:TRAP-type mannitol/chloroaromatic compound transport system permease small subunit